MNEENSTQLKETEQVPASGVPKVKKFKPGPVVFKDGETVVRTGSQEPLVVHGTCCVGSGPDGGTVRVYHVCPPEGPYNTTPNGWCNEGDLKKV